MKPFRLFLFFALLLIALIFLSWLTPHGGWDIMGVNIHFFKYTPRKELSTTTPKPIINQPGSTHYTDSVLLTTEKKIQTPKVDTSSQPQKKMEVPKKKFAESSIQFFNDTIDHWSSLKATMANIGTLKQPARIMYFGDSQIENDRITSVFRKKMQAQYGGSGRGLVPIMDIYNTTNNFIMSTSKNWDKTSVVGNKRKNIDAGLLCESFSIKKASTSPDSTEQAWVKIKTINPSKTGGYSKIQLLYRTTGEASVEVVKNGKPVHNQKLASKNLVNQLMLNFGDTPNLLELKFQTTSELVIYGLSMESPFGIMVDNIALRGKSTPEFVRLDTTTFMQMAEYIKPSFIILHYGVNVVPNVARNYGFYKNMLVKDIQFLKAQFPTVPVLLASASDMAHREKGELASYSNIPGIVKAQKEAAFENNCAFWNLYQTMGGDGSMIDWVDRIPPLGNKDYVHFTPLGASEVGKLLSKRILDILEGQKELVSHVQ